MNLKIMLQILLVLAIISTVCICITKPVMHKSVLVYDSGYIIEPKEVTKVEETEMPLMTQPPQQQTVQITANQKIDNQISEQQNRILQYIDSESKPVTTTRETKTTLEPKKVQTSQNTVKTTSNNEVKEVQTSPVKTNTAAQQKTVNAPVGNTSTKTNNHLEKQETVASVPEPSKILTAQEEEIAWNKWRSRIQNQIMKDSKLPNIPNGTVFRFTFSVDKYGKVTNVKTWAEPASYTPYAIQYIAPVIRSYQGRAILTFPTGSNRYTTDFTGGWKISTNVKYSTPQDYNDIEKISR